MAWHWKPAIDGVKFTVVILPTERNYAGSY